MYQKLIDTRQPIRSKYPPRVYNTHQVLFSCFRVFDKKQLCMCECIWFNCTKEKEKQERKAACKCFFLFFLKRHVDKMFGNSSGFLRSVKYRGQIWRELLVRTHEHKEAQRSSFWYPNWLPISSWDGSIILLTHKARSWKKSVKTHSRAKRKHTAVRNNLQHEQIYDDCTVLLLKKQCGR